MKIWMPKSRGELREYLRDPLYRNSFFLLLSSVVTALFGFLFWLLAAKFYSKGDVGIATALISSLSLLVLLTRFGLNQSLIRFSPEMDRDRVFWTSIIVTTSFAVLFGLFFLLGIDFWAPGLVVIKNWGFIYLLFLAFNSIASLTSISFVALRRAEYSFLQNLFLGSKVVFLLPFIFLGALGIFISIGLASLLAVLFSFFFLYRFGFSLRPALDKKFLNEAFHFSIGNYIAGLFLSLPSLILPILVLNILGAEEAAYYYIAYSIGAFLFIIPSAFSTSLFVEGSYGEAMRVKVLKSLLGIFLLLIPGVIVVYFFAGFLLDFIGRDYIVGLDLLRLIAFSSLFAVPFHIYFSIKEVQKRVKALISISFLFSSLLLGLSYFFMLKFGILGVGIAWLISYGLCAMFVIFRMRNYIGLR